MKLDSRNAFVFVFFVICAHHSVLSQVTAPAKSSAALRSSVPFVGCKSDGQVGPLKAPTGKSKELSIATDLARQVAYYQAEHGSGVLVPRGWNCFGTYGSNGSNLYVSPQPINVAMLFSDKWTGFTGPAIQLSEEIGGTSGRFGVAAIIARVFPAYKKFASQVIAENLRPASDFPSGPHPQDKLLYKAKNIVEFETPANSSGLETDSRLKKSATPIRGVILLLEEEEGLITSSLSLSVRLPPNLANLTSAIIQQTEQDAQQAGNGKN
jgi:hypothetical protein